MAPPRISEAVLDAAIQKAVEAGVFPRRCSEFDAAINREVMNAILDAAFHAAVLEEEPDGNSVSTHNARADGKRGMRNFH